ncbi:hypothetical protein RHS03_06382, partial [Rhizoctonia solani]
MTPGSSNLSCSAADCKLVGTGDKEPGLSFGLIGSGSSQKFEMSNPKSELEPDRVGSGSFPLAMFWRQEHVVWNYIVFVGWALVLLQCMRLCTMPTKGVLVLEGAGTTATGIVMLGGHSVGTGTAVVGLGCFFPCNWNPIRKLSGAIPMLLPSLELHFPLMWQAKPAQEKQASKDTPGISQFYNKAQGVGSSIPKSWKEKAAAKVAAKAKELEMVNVEELPDEEFDATLVEIQAQEACLNALQAKLASCNGLCFKKLQLLDKTELQRMWDQGGKGKTGEKEKEKASAVAKPLNSKVQALGPAQKILALVPALSTAQHASAKHKCSITSLSGKPNNSSKPDKSSQGSDDNSNSGKEEGDSKALETEEEDEGNEDCKTKGGTGKLGCRKMKDFTGRVKKMVDYTTICVCAKLLTSGMFRSPDRLKSAIATTYKLIGEGQTPAEAEKHAALLLPNTFHTKVGAGCGLGHFQRNFLQSAMFEAFCTGNHPVGLKYLKWFDPMPLKAIVLVCAVIQWVIKQHNTSKYVNARMTFETLQEYYNKLRDLLNAFKTGKQADRCAYVRQMFYMQSMEQAGCPVTDKEETRPADNTLGKEDFAKDTLTAAELRMIARGFKKSCTGSQPHNKLPKLPALPESNASCLVRPNCSLSHAPKLCEGDSLSSSMRKASSAWPQHSSLVSLDDEEAESNHSCEPTPTPCSPSWTHHLTTKQPNKDDEDEDQMQEDWKGSDQEEGTEEVELPLKKQKTQPKQSLQDKLVGSGDKNGKPSPAAASKAGNLKITQGTGAGKTNPHSKHNAA